MRRAHRGSLALTLPLWLVAALLGTVLPGECAGPLKPGGGNGEAAVVQDDSGQDDSGPACGMEQGDAAQVAAVRAMADEQCDCATAANHGAYVSCVDAVAAAAVADGSPRPQGEDTVVSRATQANCRPPGLRARR